MGESPGAAEVKIVKTEKKKDPEVSELLAEHVGRNATKLSERLRFLFQVLSRTVKNQDVKGLVTCMQEIADVSLPKLKIAI